MNKVIKSNITSIAQSLYRGDASATEILDYFATRKKAMKISSVDRIAYKTGVPYSEVVRVFKELADAGCGTFFNGRKGFKSRIQWDLSLVSLGMVAKGIAATVESIDAAELEDEADDVDAPADDEEDDGLVAHPFQLRPDLSVQFGLPSDLTAKEAERLAAFIRTLPFD